METNGSSSKKINVVFNDDFTLCGEFDSMMEYTLSLYVKELNTVQLKALYERNVTVNVSRLRGYFIIISKKLIKKVDFYEY